MTVGQLKEFIADLSVGDDVEVSIDCDAAAFGRITGYGFTVERDPHGVRLTCAPFLGLKTMIVHVALTALEATRMKVNSVMEEFEPLGSFDSGGGILAYAMFDQAARDASARLRDIPGVDMIFVEED
jgi:hypothetical protein